MDRQPEFPALLGELHLVDDATVGRLYEHFAPRIYRYIYRRVGDIELARDLQNDVFVAMLESLQRTPTVDAPLGPWLFRVARDRTISALRSRGRHRTQTISDNSVVCEGPDVAYAVFDEHETVRRALDRLPPAYRQVLLLRFRYNLSVPDAAAQLGRTVGALRALQHRALVALQAALQKGMHQDDLRRSRQ